MSYSYLYAAVKLSFMNPKWLCPWPADWGGVGWGGPPPASPLQGRSARSASPHPTTRTARWTLPLRQRCCSPSRLEQQILIISFVHKIIGVQWGYRRSGGACAAACVLAPCITSTPGAATAGRLRRLRPFAHTRPHPHTPVARGSSVYNAMCVCVPDARVHVMKS